VGPYGFDLVGQDQVVEFLASVGLVFLMFIAGSEIKTSHLSKIGRSAVILALVNGAVPLAVGWAVGAWFGYGLVTSVVLGIIFISSSSAVIVPVLEARGLIQTKFGEVVLAAVIFEDVGSLLLLSFWLQRSEERSVLLSLLVVAVLALLLVLLRWAMPRLRALVLAGRRGDDLFETELRLVFVVLLAAVMLFELLGVARAGGRFLNWHDFGGCGTRPGGAQGSRGGLWIVYSGLFPGGGYAAGYRVAGKWRSVGPNGGSGGRFGGGKAGTWVGGGKAGGAKRGVSDGWRR